MNAVVIGGDRWQVPLIKYLKDRCKVYVVNPVETEATKIAHHIRSDIRNLGETLKLLKEKEIHLIIGNSEESFAPSAYYADILNLPAPPLCGCFKFADKIMMSDLATELSIRVPVYDRVVRVEQVVDFCRVHRGPYILKPVDRKGSVYLDDLDHLSEKFDYVIKKSNVGQAIIQTYAKGTRIILNGIASAGRHRTLASARKNDDSIRYHSGLSTNILSKLFPSNDFFVEKSGLNFGITQSEYVVDELTGNFWLIEFLACGDMYNVTNWVSGVNSYGILVEEIMNGRHTDVKSLVIGNSPALIKFYNYGSGIVKEINIDKKVAKDFHMLINVGDVIRPGKHAVAVIVGESDGIIDEKQKQIDELVRVIVEK